MKNMLDNSIAQWFCNPGCLKQFRQLAFERPKDFLYSFVVTPTFLQCD